MSLLTVVKYAGGKLIDLPLAAAQLEGIRLTLRHAPKALDAASTDILPRIKSADLEIKLVDKARREVEALDGTMEASPHLATRLRSVKEEAVTLGGDLVATAQARELAVAAAVELWEARSDRLRAAVKVNEAHYDREMSEVKALVGQCQVAFPGPVLERLLPGARSVGLQSLPDGSVVTPGEIFAAVLRALKDLPTVSIQDGFALYAKVFAPLSAIVSPRAGDTWMTFINQLKALHREVGDQVARLTPQIVGRALVDHLHKAVGTLGGTGPSLTDLIEEGVGNGKGQSPSLSFEELFSLLLSDNVRNKVAWIANLPGAGIVKVKALKAVGAAGDVAVVGWVPGAKAAINDKDKLCFTWRDTGACPYGEHCRFGHGEI
jgi:hypothetical protein